MINFTQRRACVIQILKKNCDRNNIEYQENLLPDHKIIGYFQFQIFWMELGKEIFNSFVNYGKKFNCDFFFFCLPSYIVYQYILIAIFFF